MKLNLVVAQGTREGIVIPVTVSPFTIGRDPDCKLRPSSEAVSKRHCTLSIQNQRVLVRDLKSKNGTFVNDKKVEGEVELRNGDQLKVGPLLFKVRLEIPAKKSGKQDKDSSILHEDAGNHGSTSGPPSDRIAAMLLDMGGDEGAKKDISLGTTEMELPALPAEAADKASGPEQLAKPASKTPPEKEKAADTSSAAKAILEMYSRRSRP